MSVVVEVIQTREGGAVPHYHENPEQKSSRDVSGKCDFKEDHSYMPAAGAIEELREQDHE